MVPPKRVPYFKPGKKLKELLNAVAEASAKEDAPVAPGVSGATDVTAG
jgi:hypothetical protein